MPIRILHPVPRLGLPGETRHNFSLGIMAFPGHLTRWCRLRSYLDSTAAHGLTALDAITQGLADDPWLPRVSRLNCDLKP
jgi:hypothetical protein